MNIHTIAWQAVLTGILTADQENDLNQLLHERELNESEKSAYSLLTNSIQNQLVAVEGDRLKSAFA